MKILHAFCCSMLSWFHIKRKKKNLPSLFAMEWHFASCILLTGILIYQELFRIQILSPPPPLPLLEGTKNTPTITEASFYIAAFSLNTSENRLQCSTLHECKINARYKPFIMTVSEWFYCRKRKRIVTTKGDLKSAMFQGKRKSIRYCTAKSCLNPHASKQGYSHDITFTWSLKENLLVFFFTWTLCKWTHFHTFQPTPYSKISQLMLHPPSEANTDGHHTSLTCIHSNSPQQPEVKFCNIRGHWRYK